MLITFNIDDAKTTSITLVKPGIIAPGINNFVKKTNKLPAAAPIMPYL